MSPARSGRGRETLQTSRYALTLRIGESESLEIVEIHSTTKICMMMALLTTGY